MEVQYKLKKGDFKGSAKGVFRYDMVTKRGEAVASDRKSVLLDPLCM